MCLPFWKDHHCFHSPWSTSKTSAKPASLKSRSACFFIPAKPEESLHGQDRYIIPRATPCKLSVLSSLVAIGTASCRMNLQKLPIPIAGSSLRLASPPNHRQHLAKRLPRRIEMNSKVKTCIKLKQTVLRCVDQFTQTRMNSMLLM